MTALTSAFLCVAAVLGTALLRRAWRERGRRVARYLVFAGWAVLAVTLLVGAIVVGPVKGTALAAGFASLAALAVVALGRVYRPPRVSRGDVIAPEPLEGQGGARLGRALLKTLLAGPLGMIAAMGLAFCYATWAPGDPPTRIVIGGLFVPVLWGLAMTWTLADRHLIRSVAVLAGTAIASFALAALGGIA